MYKLVMSRHYLVLLLFTCIVPLGNVELYSKTNEPLVWNIEQLEAMKMDSVKKKSYFEIMNAGNKYCVDNPIVITDKNKTFAPDKHYYCTIGPYWWPDSLHPGRYVSRDGYVNPERNQYDKARLDRLAKKCQSLSKAFYLTDSIKYYNAFIQQIRAWFVDKDTYMYPNFEYAAVIPGRNNNIGRGAGIIDAYLFNTVIESIRLVDCVKRIDEETYSIVKAWFLAFAEWADYGVYSKDIRKGKNNIVLAYDITLVNMYLFVGKVTRAKEIADSFALKRIYEQINEDGSQPEELKRTKAFSYSLANLTHIIDFCYLVRLWYPYYYLDHHERIDVAFDFLGQYVDKEESFPFQQIVDWKNCMKDYQFQRNRLNYLQAQR